VPSMSKMMIPGAGSLFRGTGAIVPMMRHFVKKAGIGRFEARPHGEG
jgi:hypothetical protein